MTRTLETLQDSARRSAWQTAALQQTPTNLCAHRNELTAYQVCVVYKVAVRQLNLFHPDRGQDNSCRKLQCCHGVKETLKHICWTCPCAQACWQKLVSHWTGERWENRRSRRVSRSPRASPSHRTFQPHDGRVLQFRGGSNFLLLDFFLSCPLPPYCYPPRYVSWDDLYI